MPNHIVMARQLTSIGLLGAAIVALYGFALINSFRVEQGARVVRSP